jgi:hypothetical protein
MTAKYYLLHNPSTDNLHLYKAVILKSKTFKFDDVVDRMVSRGSTITRAEAYAVLEEFGLAIESIVKEGGKVVTHLFHIAPFIKGAFENEDDTFDPARHEVKLKVKPGSRFSETGFLIPVEKIRRSRPEPILTQFKDNASDKLNSAITPGAACILKGSLLKFDETQPDQGIFFINTDTEMAWRVMGKLLRNKPGELIFNSPDDLVTGTYRLEVRTILRRTRDIRFGALPYNLAVL